MTVDRTIARVNSDIITESDLAHSVGERIGTFKATPATALDKATSEDLEALLDKTLLLQAAKLRKIEPPDTEMQMQVERMIADIRTHFASEAEFRRALASEQISVEELKDQLLKRARSEYQVYQLVTARFSVSESEARSYEAECAARGESPLSLHLRRLAVPVEGKGGTERARQEVRELAARIFEEGMSFEDGVKKYSRAPGAKEDAGDLGNLSAQKLAPQVLAAVKDLSAGQASAPVVTGGYASIFYVESKHGARSQLQQKKFIEQREALLHELRRKANVQIFDTRLMKILPADYREQVAVTH
jgi:parvulin-like peptidyl-prolyl isomerase